ncbi:MAG: hypothetical protein HC843_09590 [Sphingomonadales bacterium]|nr:hypothetical protein [Sphingomonadales bacterium]
MEALSRSGRKFPSLANLLGRKGNAETRKQSNEEILAAMRTWAAMQNEQVRKEEGQGGA